MYSNILVTLGNKTPISLNSELERFLKYSARSLLLPTAISETASSVSTLKLSRVASLSSLTISATILLKSTPCPGFALAKRSASAFCLLGSPIKIAKSKALGK